MAAAAAAPLLANKFLMGLAKSFGIILASEIGDKTFFIAAVMAMRNPRLTVGSDQRGGRCGHPPKAGRQADLDRSPV